MCVYNHGSLDMLYDFGCMVTILTETYGLPSYQNTFIYKMEKCHLLAIDTVIIGMST